MGCPSGLVGNLVICTAPTYKPTYNGTGLIAHRSESQESLLTVQNPRSLTCQWLANMPKTPAVTQIVSLRYNSQQYLLRVPSCKGSLL